jgi:site-specific DNA-methyltransferase (adenine-specific)
MENTQQYVFDNKVHLEDVIIGLKKIPNNTVNVIISDPPYNIGKDFGECKDDMTMDDYQKWCNEWITESLRVLKPNGTLYVYGFSEILAHVFANTKCEFKKWLVWHYTNKNVASSNFWQRSHEAIALFANNKPIFNKDDVREPYTETFLKGAAGKTRAATKGRFSSSDQTTTYNAHEGGALPRDVIKYPALAGGAGAKERAYFCITCQQFVLGSKDKKSHESHDIINHPTQKPIELTRKLILAAKDKNIKNNVLILFSGSGAESIAALEENCNFISFEINPIYQKMANDWISYNKIQKEPNHE